MKIQSDLRGVRFSGVWAGTIVCVSLMTLMVTTVRAMINPESESSLAEMAFWVTTAVAWVGSVFLGAFVGGLASPMPKKVADDTFSGALLGLVVWATAYMVVTMIFVLRSPDEFSIFETGFLPMTLALRDLMAELVAIGAAVWGGKLGSERGMAPFSSEDESIRTEMDKGAAVLHPT